MRSKVLCIGILLAAGSSASAQPGAEVRTYGGDGMDRAHAAQVTSDGGYVVTGISSAAQEDNTDLLLLRLNGELECVWSFAYGGPGVEWGTSVAEWNDGGVVASGTALAEPDRGYDCYVVRTDPAGGILWQENYGTPEWDFGECGGISPGGTIWVAGSTYGGPYGDRDAYLVEVSPEGEWLGEWVAGGPYSDAFLCAAWVGDTLWLGGYQGTGEEDTQRRGWLVGRVGGEVVAEYFFDIPSGLAVEDMDFSGPERLLGFSAAGEAGLQTLLVGTQEDFTPLWQELETTQQTIDVLRTASYILTLGQTSAFGAGGSACAIFRRNTGGGWMDGAAFGGAADEFPSDLLLDAAGRVLMTGTTASYSEFGDEDIYLVRFPDEQIVANYVLEVADPECSVALHTDDAPPPAPEHWIGRMVSVEVFTWTGQLIRRYETRLEQSDLRGYPQPVILVIRDGRGACGAYRIP